MSASKSCGLILCDFDGTITVNDMTNVVWDRFLDYDWRARLLPDSERGLITATEMVRRGYADVRRDEGEVLALMRQSLQIRSGFAELLSLCQRRNWHFAVVSNGLRFYIEAALGSDLDIWAHDAYFDTNWHVELPKSIPLSAELDFKSQVVVELRRQHQTASCIYIGDGRLDFEPALLSDHVFCVRDSALQELFRQAGRSATEFTDFTQVSKTLAELLPAAA